MSDIKSILVLKPITELLKEKFFIPAYQRGYRWSSVEVTNLLDDIWNFRLNSETESKDAFYCLQPVVVSKKKDEWELIDGQQRLTTIYIILEYLKEGLSFLGKNNYSIRFQTRPNSDVFLKSIDISKCDDNIDYFHICNAYTTISQWFEGKDGNTKINFLNTLLNDDESGKNVKVIWYDVSEENISDNFAIDIFTRLNIGKIPLTNAELVKALFLQKGNFQEGKASLKQLQIASEWDAIEKVLQNNAFWYFIYNSNNPIKYDNRIEYIFDLMKDKNNDEKYHTFLAFNTEFAESKSSNGSLDIDAQWLKIKKYFLTFDEWYNDNEFYHLVGFLVDCNFSIKKLKDKAKNVTKTSFKAYLKDEIIKQVDTSLDELSYGDKKIKKILLLFNIQTILSTKNTDIRFPFYQYKNETWDIEHVRSQTTMQITGNARKDWAIDILEYFTGERGYSDKRLNGHGKTEKDLQIEIIASLEDSEKKYCEQLINILDSENIDDIAFKDLYNRLTIEFKEDKVIDNIDSISNLALLDAATNRSYKNAMFPIKRKTIIKNDMNGVFVPICTRNVFLKSYSKKLGDVMYWGQNDADEYLAAIKQTLKEYLPKMEDENNDK